MRRVRRAKIDTINIIPFIDIILVLFTIVLISATFISRGEMDISLPNSDSSNISSVANEQKISISIGESGVLTLNGESVDFSELSIRLESLDRELPIKIYGDKSSMFLHFIEIMDILKEKSFKNINIITQKDI